MLKRKFYFIILRIAYSKQESLVVLHCKKKDLSKLIKERSVPISYPLESNNGNVLTGKVSICSFVDSSIKSLKESKHDRLFIEVFYPQLNKKGSYTFNIEVYEC